MKCHNLNCCSICIQSKVKLVFSAKIGILLSKLFWPTVRSDWEKTFEGQEFAKLLRSLEQSIQQVKDQNNFGNKMLL